MSLPYYNHIVMQSVALADNAKRILTVKSNNVEALSIRFSFYATHFKAQLIIHGL